MKFFCGKLLKVETGEFNSLTFESKKFDMGLGKFVDCSESVGISKECLAFVNNYKQHIGEVILIGINVIKTQKGGIFSFTSTNILNINDLGLEH